MNYEVLILVTIVVLAIFYLITHFLYVYLEKKGVVPIVYDSLTGKKRKVLFFEFLRTFFFVLLAVVFLLSGKLGIFLCFLCLALIQFGSYFLKMKEETKSKKVFELTFNDNEEKEWNVFLDERFQKRNKYKARKKVVLVEDVLYFDKRKKILLKDKMYHYIFLNRIDIEENFITFKYGFMGIPMWREFLYVPKRKKKEIDEFMKKVQEARKKNNFFRK